MQRLNVLLFNRFCGDEAHVGTAHGLTDGLGVVSIILVRVVETMVSLTFEIVPPIYPATVNDCAGAVNGSGGREMSKKKAKSNATLSNTGRDGPEGAVLGKATENASYRDRSMND